MTVITPTSNLNRKIPGKTYLWLAILIFGAANAITRKLTEIGAQNLIDGRNPISFCNVLFVGNICALVMLILIYRRQWNIANLKQISWQNWLSLSFMAILSGALAPSLIFIALDHTMVTNVILIGRIETPLTLALSIWLIKERVNILTIFGAIISLLGVFTTVFLQVLWENMMSPSVFMTVGVGEIMVGIAAIALSISTIISKTSLQQIPLGIFSVFRISLATIVFFCIVLYLYGSQHFIDVFAPFLWQWMLIYSAVIVVFGQICWFTGLKRATTSDISLASSFTPIAGILAAYFILKEAPTAAQYIGGSIVLLGIFLSHLGNQRQQHSLNTSVARNNIEQKMTNAGGFQGL
ncbi:DMT family transporter [Iningainema tapete]|uniref:DMT family transporter n=1 Tax=Iningainema tapete BLCC-T55 TaxID=2748662 RepID=A0A8J6XNF4_9CYAN|nr:DMT family transporter [Iningainema tapete]MBD2773617.1 DMT family transporter [Iningainema tapete BLCC-T55]